MYETKAEARSRRPFDGTVATGPAPAALAPRPAADPLGILWRGRDLVMACLVFGAAAAIALLLVATPRYAATATLIIDPSDLRTVDKGLREQATFSDAQVAQVENEVRVLTSASVLGAVVDGQGLDRDAEFTGAGPSLVATLMGSLGLHGAGAAPEPRLDAMRALAKDLVVKREERTYAVSVTVTTREQAKSVRLADAVVTAFLKVSAEQHSGASRRIAASLQGRLSELRSSVEAADRRLVEYRQQNNLVAAVGQNVTEQQLAEASTSLGLARKRVEDLRSRFNQFAAAQRTGDIGAIPDALQSNTVAALRNQLAQVMRKKGDMTATLGPRHPDVGQIESEERGLRGVLRDELKRIGEVTKSDLARALDDQKAALATFDRLKASVAANSESSVRLRELEREVEAARTVYGAFLVRTREVSEQEGINPTDVRVISSAQPLEARAWPPRPALVLIGGLLLGLLLGCGLAVARDARRTRAGGEQWPLPRPAGGDVRYVS